MPSHLKSLLISSTISAVVTFICVCVSLFTEKWVTVTLSAFITSFSLSAGIFPWGCVSSNTCNIFWDNADGWDIAFFSMMLLAWIFQFFALIPAAMAVCTPRFRRKTHRFCVIQGMVTLLLLVVLITYGIEYNRNTADLLSGIDGLSLSLGSSYWLLLVATIFSLVTTVISSVASMRMLLKDRPNPPLEQFERRGSQFRGLPATDAYAAYPRAGLAYADRNRFDLICTERQY